MKGGNLMAKTQNLLGSWAFLIGVILAIVLGLIGVQITEVLTIVLVVIGIVVGLFNINAKESTPFLLSGIALIIASVFGVSAVSAVPKLGMVLIDLLVIFVPATIVVALRNVFVLARN
jgi:uncharacterized membrane protein